MIIKKKNRKRKKFTDSTDILKMHSGSEKFYFSMHFAKFQKYAKMFILLKQKKLFVKISIL